MNNTVSEKEFLVRRGRKSLILVTVFFARLYKQSNDFMTTHCKVLRPVTAADLDTYPRVLYNPSDFVN